MGHEAVHSDYTPRRVRWWLERYQALQAASEGACGLGDLSGDGGLHERILYPATKRPDVDPSVDPRYYQVRSRTNRVKDLATLALCVKADLDMATRRALSSRERQVVVWRWHEEWTVEEVAAKLRVSRQMVCKVADRCCFKIAEHLGYARAEKSRAGGLPKSP